MARPAARQDGPRRQKPVGKLARFADARKNNQVDLLADCERLLLRENADGYDPSERRHDVIHPSEMAKSDWCPRSTYLRILHARAGTLPEKEAHHFQLENIFEEGHEYHRKWQDRFRRMGRLFGSWKCEACRHRWEELSPEDCPECGAPAGALTYKEVRLVDTEHNIAGNADGIVLDVDLADDEGEDFFIEVKSIGEGTVRLELPAVLSRHTYEVDDKQWAGKTKKVLDHRGVWREITKPFGPHLRQGLIYLRLWGQANEKLPGDQRLSDIKRIVFIYEYKPTSQVKAFYVTRNDEAVQELWDQAGDIVYALDKGGRPPRCIDRDGPCKECLIYEGLDHDSGTSTTSRTDQGEPRGRRRAREAGPAAAEEAEDRGPRPRRGGSVGSRGQRPDRQDGDVHEMGGLLGRPARTRRRR